MKTNMKQTISVLLAALLLFGVCGISAFAESDPASAGITVYVTVAKAGQTVAVREAVTVTDIDSDGALTVNDALYALHEAKYTGGAAAGYSSYQSDFGLSLGKLWGDTSGAYGYCVNNTSCMSLADPVKELDHVYAYVYADQTGWSDVYSYFNTDTATVEAGGSVTLTLCSAGYDESWNPVTLPVANASITVDGKATAYKTDAEGKVTVTLSKAGACLISATSAEQTLVPPVCTVQVTAKEAPVTQEPTTQAPAQNSNPQPDIATAGGCQSAVLGVSAVVLVICAATLSLKRKEE